jgi:hypothetical protein
MKIIKDKLRTRLLTGLSIIMICLLPCFVVAQDPGQCPDCPIDGGLCLLLAAGVGYGFKKNRDRKKIRQENL